MVLHTIFIAWTILMLFSASLLCILTGLLLGSVVVFIKASKYNKNNMLTKDDLSVCREIFSRYGVGNKMANINLIYGNKFMASDFVNAIYIPKD